MAVSGTACSRIGAVSTGLTKPKVSAAASAAVTPAASRTKVNPEAKLTRASSANEMLFGLRREHDAKSGDPSHQADKTQGAADAGSHASALRRDDAHRHFCRLAVEEPRAPARAQQHGRDK